MAGITVSKTIGNNVYEATFCKNYVKCCDVNQDFCTYGAAVKKEIDGSCDAILGVWNNENAAFSESLCPWFLKFNFTCTFISVEIFRRWFLNNGGEWTKWQICEILLCCDAFAVSQ